ncbi:hypothetical protein A3A01_00920 [Candidatus Nomurabacteria bacterium RIFCSPLOWO2_01_FULL_39_17]|uniref:SHS2 domain-containing protein n=1 Tax=Candidatus Nomurabacteria bacterium RIFCSPLOWO2_01_FULL_39_17 TaxID=1801770 RepID=A0A1F6WVQ5_9BACT|nr:MAG: hypothetical protein A3A01_00920 [Candidatus Nomurabacteria bacterium RIFCSPLOWO2_01_FULL_39_17]
MFGISSSKEKEELMLVFDVGSSSVGGAFFVAQKSSIPRLIFSLREPIALEEKINIDIDRFLLLTIKSLETVASKICLRGIGAPSEVFCVLSSPWHVSQTRTVNLEKNTPFIFTPELASSLIDKEVKFFEDEHLAQYENDAGGIRSIELKNMKVMLNGYEAPNPVNQKAKMLSMTLFFSMSPEIFLKKIEEAICRYFHCPRIKFSSFTMASFTIVRDLFINQRDFLLVDIRGELTDISMIKQDILKETASFPMGLNFIIRGIAFALNCSLDEARSFFSLYKEGHASKLVEKRIGPIILFLKAEWLRKFQESLSNLSNDISIPANVFITANPELADFFIEIIKKEQFNQYSFTESKFQITFLGTETLHGLATFKENVVRDPALIIESIYINRYLLK